MIYINGRFLTQRVTGVQRFATEMTRELSALTDVTILTPPSCERRLDGIKTVEVGTHFGHRWEQLDLPKSLNKLGCPLLLNLASTGPMFYQNQVATHHDITYVRYPQSFSQKFRIVYNIIVPRYLRNSRVVLTVSDFSKREIAEHYKISLDKINVIHAAVDKNIFFDDDRRREKFFLMVSSPSYHKNFEIAVKAFNRANLGADVKLKIVGSASDSFAYIDKESFSNVEWLGSVTDSKLVDLYRTAVAFIFPSLYEGFGIPPIEAQACGCPVLASHAASMPEVLGTSVEYFHPQDLSSITSAIRGFFDDEQRRSSYVNRGFENVKRYSWDISARKLANLLIGLVK